MNQKDSILLEWKKAQPAFDLELKNIFKIKYFDNNIFDKESLDNLCAGSDPLGQAIEYSLFTGGKRFRPMLTFASCLVLNKNFKEAIHWAMAIECVHTYSLIHDDLPCMDNDDERRGQPTVHKKFDEATALLAGDALLTEAFGLIGAGYNQNKNLGELIMLLSSRSGFKGMVSGQANDLAYNITANKNKNFKSKNESELSLEERQVLFIHFQKTAALMSAAGLGPFLIFDQDEVITEKFNELILILGLLFQLKDDFLDVDVKIESNMVQSLGTARSESIYSKYKIQAEQIIEKLSVDLNLKPYQELIDYNDAREV